MITLALKNLGRNRSRTILNIIAVVVAMSTLFVFMSLAEGIRAQTLESQLNEAPLTQIKVRPIPKEASIFQLLSKKTNLLNDEDLATIKALDGVAKVNEETQFRNVSSIEMSLLNQNFITDSMILGVPYDFIKNDITVDEAKWKSLEGPIPIIISNKLINLYNYSVANSSHLPGLKKEFLIGMEMKIRLNYSSFFPEQQKEEKTYEGIIVGVSDKVSFLGVTIPEHLVHQWNHDLYDDYEKTYLELYVRSASQEKTVNLAKRIEELGYQTSYIQQDLKSIERNFLYLKLVLLLISSIILFTAAISIANTFLAAVSERKREIGILRALGATKQKILILFLEEAALLGLIGGIISIFIGILANKLLDSLLIKGLSELGNEVSSLFKVSPELVIFSILFAMIISVLAALAPAYKAAQLTPLEALRK